MKKSIILVIIIGAALFMYHCNPERSYIEDQDAKLKFSLDTVYFDTVLTTVGTITKSFKIYNPHNRYLNISGIDLAGGSISVFRMNVDGVSGIEFDNFEIAPEDSMYVFVQATLDPNGNPDILRIQDSIIFSVNGNLQDIDLVAWGQDVHMLRDSVLDYSTTWIADKPYLIIDSIFIDTLQTLTIEEGVDIYMHRNALIIVQGTLQLKGSLDNPIVIQGDRLEKEFQDDPGYPGQWIGIWFIPGSQNNIIDHAKILNGTIGLRADSVVNFDAPVITVSNTEINRMSYDGILALGTTIEAYNTVIGECGNSCVELLIEGSYSFNHCTFANYWQTWQSNRKTPALNIRNFFAYQDTATNQVIIQARDIQKAEFTNCIIHGDRENEIVISKAPGENVLNYHFENVLTSLDQTVYDYRSDPHFVSIINDEKPLFDSLRVSYELDTLSPAIDAGKMEFAIDHPFDKKGYNLLTDEANDLGAFERIEE
ncbi:MAG: hypothetical protein PF450_14280 [Bacteroidales bacterium]|nr:hypothetical protein [Bacteroidales bacterium]